jgi:hypothetical protein
LIPSDDRAERTLLSTLLGKAQTGSRPFDLLQSRAPAET